MLRFSIVLSASLVIASLTGCPKGGPVDPTANPTQGFAAGVDVLESGKAGKVDYDTAYGLFSGAAIGDPSMAKAHFNAGWTAERLGHLTKAARHYRDALKQDTSYSAALFALGNVLAQLGKGAEAVILYQSYLAKNPNDIPVRNNLVEALAASENYDEAIEESREILRRDHKNVGAYRNLSRIYFAKGMYPMSQLCAEKAKEFAKGDAGIYNNIGVTYLVMDQKQTAIKEFKTAIKLEPGNVQANLNLGYVAVNSGDYILAKRCFETALEGNPGNIDGKLGLAVALRGTKDFNEAGKLYDEVIAADPRSQQAYFNAATLHEKYTKDYKKAAKYLDDFVKAFAGQLGPDHEVFTRQSRVSESQAREEAEKQKEEQKKREAEERKKRQQQTFEELKAAVAKLDVTLKTYASCTEMLDSGGMEMGMMVLEQAQVVVEAKEIDMAADVMTFIDELQPQLDAIVPACLAEAAAVQPPAGDAPAPSGDAPAPSGDAPAPSSGDAPAPSGDAPAPSGDDAPAPSSDAAPGGDAPAPSEDTTPASPATEGGETAPEEGGSE